MVTMLDCITRGWGSRPVSAEILFKISVPFALKAHSEIISTLTTRCRREDETAMERSGHPPHVLRIKC